MVDVSLGSSQQGGKYNVKVADRYYTGYAFDYDYSDLQIYADKDNRNVLFRGSFIPVNQFSGASSGIAVSPPKIHPGPTHGEVSVFASSSAGKSFVDRFYNKIHVRPKQIALGNLLGTVVTQISVWNAYFVQKEFIDIQGFNDEGLEFTWPGNGPIPFQINSLEEIQGELEAVLEGPAVIDADFDFVFPDGEIIRVTVTGQRTLTWPVTPDMGQGYGEKFKWTTDIITAENGREQRISLRDSPELAIEASYTAFFEKLNLADALLWGWQTRIFAIPLFHLPVTLTANVQNGDLEIKVSDLSYKRFDMGELFVIHCDELNYEPLQIDSLDTTPGDNKINLLRPVQGNWPAGTKLYPMRLARTEKSISGQWPVNRVGTMQMRFVLEDDEVFVPSETSLGSTLYQGYYVLPIRPNWIESMTQQFTRNVDIIENDIGPREYTDHSDLTTVIRSFLFQFHHLSNIHFFMQWYYARRGAQVPFWVPTWNNDMILVKNVINGESVLTIKNTQYSRLYVNNEGRNHLYIATRTGQIITTEILNIQVDPLDSANELVTVDALLPDIDYTLVDIICFMGLNRMASDELTVEWLSDKVARINSNMRLLSDGV